MIAKLKTLFTATVLNIFLEKGTFLKKDCELDDSKVLNVQFNVKILHQPKQSELVFIFFFSKHAIYI